MAMLASMRRVSLKEKLQLMEVLIGFEMPNKYIISNECGVDCFVAGERSQGAMGMLGRQVFEGGERPWSLDMALLRQGFAPQPFCTLNRPFACTCCCLGRPFVNVTDMNGQRIGTIKDPFNCCHITFSICDKNDQEVLVIRHPVCSPEMLCWGCPCGCQEVKLEVCDAGTGAEVATIHRVFTMSQGLGMVTGIGVDADNYTIDFGRIENPEWKLMIIATALFLDFRWFTKGGQSQREGSVMGRGLQGYYG